MKGLGGYPEVLQQSQAVSLPGVRLRVLLLEGLILNKRAAARPKDLLLLPELEALLEMQRTEMDE